MKQRDNTNKQVDNDIKLGEVTEAYIKKRYEEKRFLVEKYKGYYKPADLKIITKDGKFLFDIEIKTDLESHTLNKTWNDYHFFIEYKCNGNDSGINTTNSKYWFHSDGYQCVVFTVDWLKEHIKKYKDRVGPVFGYGNETYGYLIPKYEILIDLKDEVEKIFDIDINEEAYYHNIKKYKM